MRSRAAMSAWDYAPTRRWLVVGTKFNHSTTAAIESRAGAIDKWSTNGNLVTAAGRLPFVSLGLHLSHQTPLFTEQDR